MFTPNTPKIYIACLSAYVSGYLHGKWVDATLDVEDIQEEIKEILSTSPVPDAEEHAIHDYDNFYEAGSYLGEYPDLEKVVEVARMIEEHGKLAAKLVSHLSGDVSEAARVLEEDYIGVYESVADYVEEFSRQCHEIPEWLEFYIDWESMADDWEMSGDIFTIEMNYQEIHIFWNR